MNIIITRDIDGPAGKVAEAELHFDEDDGPLSGLKLVGFGVWERRPGDRKVTFPSRQYVVNGERRSFSLLRVSDTSVSGAGTAHLHQVIIDAYESEETTNA